MSREFDINRRRLLQAVPALAVSLMVPDGSSVHAQAPAEKPPVLTLHGYNGSPDNGFILALNNYLLARDYQISSPQLPGGMDPSREIWQTIIRQEIDSFDRPPVVVAYSLSVIAALGVLSSADFPVARLVTVGGRKIRPGLPSNMPTNLVRFYGGELDSERIIQNTAGGRLVVHSTDDGVVRFEGNAVELAGQLQADRLFVSGYGHFDRDLPSGFSTHARRMVG